MKLNEIVFSNNNPPNDLSALIDSLYANNKKLKQLNSKQYIGKSGNKFTFVYKDEIIGFLSLGKTVTINHRQYDPVILIHIEEKYRKSFIAGLFLIGIDKLLEHPLIIGDKIDDGGGPSINGKDLVKSLHGKKSICVKVLDLISGKERPLEDNDLQTNNANITFVFTAKNHPLEYASEDFRELGMNLWFYEDPEKEDGNSY